MSLLAQVRTGAATAFAAVGDLAESITIRRQVSGAYDPQTGGHASTLTPTSFTVDGIPDDYSANQLATTIEISDVRVYILVADATFEPTNQHRAIFRGVDWAIMSVKNHARTLYELQLRRAS